ncbi:lipid phosphate phosphatase epsilon 2, chloroplastic-like isoform X1 [Camellia sinensis]|uniref:lipid phosphate phosphatase epsilon 2, chloroplastic-like isoform X1 n=1 Tax=Camellia sinensis TaxID=4442 RepID=UPI001035ACB4|nr:lipid phosphate phosphatase epsilon 2, chloroplastic-like isoform X1 [Camellia sinensis]
MSALTPIILYKPTSTTRTTIISYAFLLLPSLKSLKIVSNPEFPSSRLLFSGEFVSRKPVLGCKRARNRSRPNTMTGSISSSGYRGSSSDEGVRVLQQDSSIHGSSEFPPNFTVVRLESTLNRLSKWIVTALFGAILLWRHDAEALWAAMGSVANVGLSTVLKQLLNQERPVSNLRSDPGMPSSHAQSIFFTFVFAVFSMVENLGINELTIALSVLTLAFGAYLSWLRVSQQLHTISQVAVGGVLGSIFSILWFWLWNAIVLKAFTSYFVNRSLILLEDQQHMKYKFTQQFFAILFSSLSQSATIFHCARVYTCRVCIG